MTYCKKCGNTYITLQGTPCDCKPNVESFFGETQCLDIPAQYQGIAFNEILVRKDLGDYYNHLMGELYRNITTLQFRNTNMLICSPINSSKSILAYSCLEKLFRINVKTFPVFDIFEIRKMTLDLDLGKNFTYVKEEPERVLTVPYLFCKVPHYTTFDTFPIMQFIIDRRVRRGNSTIFLYDGTRDELERLDSKSFLKTVEGEGNFNSLKIYNFWIKGD